MAKKRTANKRRILFAALIVIIAVPTLIFTFFAYFVRHSIEVKNTLNPALSVIPPINEEFTDGIIKSNVNISIDEEENRTEYPVYVRAKLVITWQCTETDSGGNKTTITYYKAPELDKDYSLTINQTDWIYNEADGFYYYDYIVPSGDTTTNLIEKCETKNSFIDEYGKIYTLSVNIIVQTVQAVGYTDDDNPKGTIPAVEDAWGWQNPPTATSAAS